MFIRKDAFWFGECQSRVVVTVSKEKMGRFEMDVEDAHGFVIAIGKVTSGNIKIDGEDWGNISHWKNLYDTAIEKQLSKELESEGALGMI